MLAELKALDSLGAEMCRRAKTAGVMLIWRAQTRTARHVLVRDGKPESSSISSIAGHGIQIVSEEGYTSLASRDDFNNEQALALLERTIRTTEAGAQLKLKRSLPFDLKPTVASAIPEGTISPDSIDLTETGRRLVELEAEIAGRVKGVQLRFSYQTELECWRIFRSDGTDVLFAMPRSILNMRATAGSGGTRHSVSASVPHPLPGVLDDEQAIGIFMQRAEAAARLSKRLPDAPNHPAGSFPLVIDYALAKGLAHEAFGHAAEADGYRSSILADQGRLRLGDKVGAEHVSIIDQPVEGDHAWQPFSANGVRRERVVIVDHGILTAGLSDPWSAEAGGVPLSGAARAGSFRNAPLPRMTNIRLVVDEPLPAPGPFEAYGPEEVRDLLATAGVFKRHPQVVFLSGYTGGQVNTSVGDFVFNCQALYTLTPSSIDLYKPAIFAGSMFGALESIREGFGPLKLDAIGYCGKWGQQVPSSGGSHYFLMVEPEPTVRLGGS